MACLKPRVILKHEISLAYTILPIATLLAPMTRGLLIINLKPTGISRTWTKQSYYTFL